MVNLFAGADAVVDVVAGATGRQTDHIRLTLAIIFQLPLGMFMNLFVTDNKTVRHMYSTTMGVIL